MVHVLHVLLLHSCAATCTCIRETPLACSLTSLCSNVLRMLFVVLLLSYCLASIAIVMSSACTCTVAAFDEGSWVIAERSEANNRDLWASESQLAFIYIYIYVYLSVTLSRPRGGGGQATCSKWRL